MQKLLIVFGNLITKKKEKKGKIDTLSVVYFPMCWWDIRDL